VARRALALLALGLLAGCAGNDRDQETPQAGRRITAPPQQTARIVAVRLRFGNPPRVALVGMGDDGSKLKVLVEAPTGDIQRLASPAWSPNAEQVYFVGVLGRREGDRFTYFESDTFVVGAGGGEPRRLTTSRDVETVAPSPDGGTLLVTREEHPGTRPFTSALWLMDADGGKERRLLETEDGTLDRGGSWSPDGGTIAFTRCPYAPPDERGFVENTCTVYTVSSDGSRLRKLAERSSQPAFSPGGRLIAFISDRDEHGKHATGEDEEAFANELYVMDADGGNHQRLTQSESLDEENPSWSPDGSRIAFAREGPARFTDQLMIVNADGTCPTLLIGDAGDASIGVPSFDSPTWRPGRLTGNLSALACN
jgi:TolB protein